MDTLDEEDFALLWLEDEGKEDEGKEDDRTQSCVYGFMSIFLIDFKVYILLF